MDQLSGSETENVRSKLIKCIKQSTCSSLSIKIVFMTLYFLGSC